MGNCCGDDLCSADAGRPLGRWRAALWIALAVNGGMFAVEGAAGLRAGSASLQADALDFLGDAGNYAIALGVAGLALAWRARAALLKGVTMLGFGLWVAGVTIWGALHGEVPRAETMGVIGALALFANVGVAVLLYRFREGDSNMRSVWICSRNDAVGNVAVMLAAAAVAGTGTRWPDLAVAAVISGLALQGGWHVVRHAIADLRTKPAPAPVPVKAFEIVARRQPRAG